MRADEKPVIWTGQAYYRSYYAQVHRSLCEAIFYRDQVVALGKICRSSLRHFVRSTLDSADGFIANSRQKPSAICLRI